MRDSPSTLHVLAWEMAFGDGDVYAEAKIAIEILHLTERGSSITDRGYTIRFSDVNRRAVNALSDA